MIYVLLASCKVQLFFCHKKLPKIWWFKKHRFIILQFCGSKFWHRSQKTKIRVLEGLHFFLEVLRENVSSFPASRAAHIPWLVTLSSIFRGSNGQSGPSHIALLDHSSIITFLSDFSQKKRLFTLKDSCD